MNKGMLDGRDYGKMVHYFYRGAFVGDSNPALLMFECPTMPQRLAVVEGFAKLGLSAFVGNGDFVKAQRDAIPDSLGLSDEQIQKIPELLRNFKCDGKIESGEPYCEKSKYNTYHCPVRKGMASWHPGLYVYIGLFLWMYGISLFSFLIALRFYPQQSTCDGWE